MQQLWERALDHILRYSPNVLAAIVIFLIGKWAASLLAASVERLMQRPNFNKTFSLFIKNLTYYGTLVVVMILALNKLGIETTSFIAFIGAAGLAVALALQGSLSNFAAGVMLVFFKPFEVGDKVDVAGAGGASGTVQEISAFSTIITADDKKMIVPNSKITSEIITVYKKS